MLTEYGWWPFQARRRPALLVLAVWWELLYIQIVLNALKEKPWYGKKRMTSRLHLDCADREGHTCCHRLNVCVSLKSIFWSLMSSLMAFGSGASGRWWGISTLIKEITERGSFKLPTKNKVPLNPDWEEMQTTGSHKWAGSRTTLPRMFKTGHTKCWSCGAAETHILLLGM